LLLTTSEPVQPHYIIRHEESTGNEIDAMNIIRRAVLKKYPELRPNLLSTIYTNEDLIPSFKEIDDSIKNAVASYFGKKIPFQSFENPLEDMTKMDCYQEATDKGWDDLLKMTSFCRRPRRRGGPCGTCGPCCDALQEGMGFRLALIPR
jgi:hypothetical protein